MLSLKGHKGAIGGGELLQGEGPRAVHATIESGIPPGRSKPRNLPKRGAGRRTKRRSNPHYGRATQTGWLANCMRNDNGEPLPNLANAMMALRNDPAIAGCFAYDQMLCAPLLVAPLPGSEPAAVRPVADTDVAALQEWLQHAGLHRMGKDTTHQAVDLRAHQRAFHPVRDYLTALEWDGKSRIATWLADYLGAEPTLRAGRGLRFCSTLPRNDSTTHVGTIFHEQLPDGSLQQRVQMKFSPNTGHAFAVTDDTYHRTRSAGIGHRGGVNTRCLL